MRVQIEELTVTIRFKWWGRPAVVMAVLLVAVASRFMDQARLEEFSSRLFDRLADRCCEVRHG